MKKIFLIALMAVAVAGTANAQRPGKAMHEKECDKHPDITEMVSDLSSAQKRKLETITKESKERMEPLRKMQASVRDSIGMLMDREGDFSKVIFPLFDRDARLQAEISREMYVTKVRIDQVLTKEQRQELAKMRQMQKREHHEGKGLKEIKLGKDIKAPKDFKGAKEVKGERMKELRKKN